MIMIRIFLVSSYVSLQIGRVPAPDGTQSEERGV
jgi:hypothetical protein